MTWEQKLAAILNGPACGARGDADARDAGTPQSTGTLHGLTYGRHECADYSPPWFTGRWRDWHRGHGCRLDDGKPRNADAQAEINEYSGGQP